MSLRMPTLLTPLQTSARYIASKFKRISILITIDPATGEVDAAGWRWWKKKDGDQYGELHYKCHSAAVEAVRVILETHGYQTEEATP